MHACTHTHAAPGQWVPAIGEGLGRAGDNSPSRGGLVGVAVGPVGRREGQSSCMGWVGADAHVRAPWPGEGQTAFAFTCVCTWHHPLACAHTYVHLPHCLLLAHSRLLQAPMTWCLCTHVCTCLGPQLARCTYMLGMCTCWQVHGHALAWQCQSCCVPCPPPRPSRGGRWEGGHSPSWGGWAGAGAGAEAGARAAAGGRNSQRVTGEEAGVGCLIPRLPPPCRLSPPFQPAMKSP